ncbi:SDR family NAD(P)-dependent oxidoreductase [Amycolatopsis sp. cmx-8-4]|uniref:SDR family NAD(P)-dependent oxidoreductase n=1 Tax=Amycolatopsis sp. cmx-8-4 TaxID=2790947 RepID=UPI003979A1F0
MGTLTGKTALITGGSEGIGLGIADAFAREGADLVLLARDPGKLDAVAARLHGASVRTVAVDLAEPDALAALPADLAVDVLVNNAGVTHLKSLEDTTPADFDAMVRVNLSVPFRLVQRLLPGLVAARGSVVNISSYWGTKMVAGRPASVYSATRGALNSFTQALASELGPAGVRVNAIVPGSVRTPAFERRFLGPMSDDQRAEYDDYVRRSYPAGRIGLPADVAAAALYLVAPANTWVTGSILTVDGGFAVR